MDLEKIQEHWRKDAPIDPTDLKDESLRNARLHQKYQDILSMERYILRKMEMDLKQLKLGKKEFFFQGHNEETRKKGWELPAQGRISLKSELSEYVEADNDVIELTLNISLQSEKVEYLSSILQHLKYRNMDIKNAIDFMKLTIP